MTRISNVAGIAVFTVRSTMVGYDGGVYLSLYYAVLLRQYSTICKSETRRIVCYTAVFSVADYKKNGSCRDAITGPEM